ncbi:MAG: NAD(P)H-hydrate epimerase, partial [Ignavibacteria bacterium]|nr:NAD(P)H-hydrate epimerase [Ignavibacteria bacterium]
MRSCFTFGETRDVESGIISSGVPSLLLMENAGANFSFVLKKIFPDLNEFKIFIVTGKGNNAGDGFVIARHLLIDGYDVSLIMLCDSSELKGDVKVNFDLLIKLGFSGLSFSSFGDVNNYKKFILIDAVLGTGLSGSPQGIFAEAIVNINKLRASKRKSRVVSVDVPSGLAADSDICVNADFTITMGCEKAELLFGKGKESTGEVHIADIGIGSEVFNKMNSFGKFIPDMKDINALFPRRKKSSYKYSNGKALIIGGSRNLSGALIMSSLAALRTGCGAVISAYPESVSSHLGRKLYEAIKLPLNETTDGSLSADSYDKLISQIDNSDAVLI